ncbi:hypothetical protein ACP275_12G071000 [Erythranthe tilingii]
MQTTSLQSLHLRPHLFSGNFTCPKEPLISGGRRKRASSSSSPSISVLAMKNDANSDHKLVDQNMVVLKMRIQEMRIKEENLGASGLNDEHRRNWLDKWEDEYWPYEEYNSDVFEAVGFLQNLLMNTRPSFVFAVVALLIFSASTSVALVLTYLLSIFM